MGLGDVPGAGLDYLRAEHEVKYRQAMFDLLMKQYDAAKLDESREAAIIQVIEPAIEPDRRSSPPRGFILLLSIVLGLLCGCIAALVQWWLELAEADPVAAKQLSALKRALSGTRSEKSWLRTP
jgi:uncharacterized protein involved in exopolysaccharide biosynthesis